MLVLRAFRGTDSPAKSMLHFHAPSKSQNPMRASSLVCTGNDQIPIPKQHETCPWWDQSVGYRRSRGMLPSRQIGHGVILFSGSPNCPSPVVGGSLCAKLFANWGFQCFFFLCKVNHSHSSSFSKDPTIRNEYVGGAPGESARVVPVPFHFFVSKINFLRTITGHATSRHFF